MVCLLVGRSAGWLVGRCVGWLVVCLVGRLVCWCACVLVGWLVGEGVVGITDAVVFCRGIAAMVVVGDSVAIALLCRGAFVAAAAIVTIVAPLVAAVC